MLEEIISSIKKKKELSSLDDDFVKQKIERVLEREKRIREKIGGAKSFKQISRSKEFAELKQLVRAELRAVYGVFDLDVKKERKELLRRLEEKPDSAEIILKLLSLHQSSKERLPRYMEIYKRIISVTGVPEAVLDLGCGANPYAYQFLQCRTRYVAADLPSEDLSDISEFFRIEKIDGCVLGIDLVNEYDKLCKIISDNGVDVVFLFKVLDSLETIKRNISGKIIDALANTKWIIVSFPTVSLGGRKRIREERRAWFEKLLARNGLSYEKFTVGDEVFYIIKK